MDSRPVLQLKEVENDSLISLKYIDFLVMDAVGNVGLAYKALPMEAAKAFATKETGADSNKSNVKK